MVLLAYVVSLAVAGQMVVGEGTEELERFVLAGNRSSVEQFFVQGTQDYLYYSLMQMIDSGEANSTRFRTFLQSFESQGDFPSIQKLKLRSLLRQWDQASTPASKQAVLIALNRDFLYYDLSATVKSPSLAATSPYPSSLPSVDTSIPASVYTDYWEFAQLKPAAYGLLDISRFSPHVLTSYFERAELSIVEGVPQAVSAYLRTNQVWAVSRFFAKMTAAQLELLATLSPAVKRETSFLDAILLKKFPLLSQKLVTKSSVQNDVEQAVSYVQSTSSGLERELLRRSLILGLFTDRQSEATFQRYLTLRRNSVYVYSQYLLAIDRYIPAITEEELVDEYACKYFAGKASLPEYSQLFEPAVLATMLARANVLAGRNPGDYGLSPQVISEWAKSVELEVERNNKERFAVNETVALKIRRKNVQKLIVTIIELNPESYYRSTLAPLPADINLDGVVSKYERVLENSDSPLLRVFETLSFPELSNRAGLFVVEIVGNGRNARALIRKGGLKYSSVQSVAGFAVTIYGSDGEIVNNESVGVILDGKVYKRSESQTYVLLPFAQQSSVKPLILLANGLSELVSDFTHDAEHYTLKCVLFAQRESLVSDDSASVLIAPRLYVNDFSAPLDLLEKPTAKVVLTDVSGLTSSQTFPDLQLSGRDSTVQLDFDVPKGTVSLTVELTAEVLELNTGKRLRLTAANQIAANDQWNPLAIFDLYLRSHVTDDKWSPVYEIHAIGRNGEALANVTMDVTIETVYSQRTQAATLSASADGVVALGKLVAVSRITVVARSEPQITRSWDLAAMRSQVAYPETIVLCKNESVDIPVMRTGLSAVPRLLRVADDLSVISADTPAFNTTSSTVSLSNLADGVYILKLPSQQSMTQVLVRVVAGVRLSSQAVVGERRVYADTSPYLPVGLESVSVAGNSITIRLSGAVKSAQVKVLMRNYADSGVDMRWESLVDSRGKAGANPAVPGPNSVYLRSRQLDDELRYIIDRKTAKNKRGISYPLPSVLLKPKEIDDTVTDLQSPQEGSPFGAPTSSPPPMAEPNAGSEEPCDLGSSDGLYYDFLSSAATVLSATSDSSGLVTLTSSEISHFSLFEVIVTNRESAAQAVVCSGNKAVEKKDVTLSVALDGMKKYAEVRKILPMLVGQKLNVKDISSSTFASIDSVEKLLRVMVQLGESKGKIGSEGRKWLFLGAWGSFSQSEKEAAYSEFVSHEMNFFLYYKDRAFFDSVVRPFLVHKLEKTFIDDYLLGNSLTEYTKLETLQKMPLIEQALLARKTNNPQLLAYLRDKKAANPLSVQDSRWVFDSVLRFSLEDSYTPQDTQPAAVPMAPYTDAGNTTAASGPEADAAPMPEFAPNAAPMPAPQEPGMGERSKSRPYYRQLDSTKEFAETQYYGGAPSDCSERFWSDVAHSDEALPLLPETLMEAYLSTAEVVMAAGLVSLPWLALHHPFVPHQFSFEMTVASNCLVFHKDIQAVSESPLDTIALAHYLSDPLQPSNPVTEIVRTHAYQSTVVLTNMSPNAITIETLVQVPQGSVALGNFQHTTVETVTVQGYETQRVERFFYFPRSGDFAHASVYAAVDGKVVKSTAARGLKVLDRESRLNLDSFRDVARAGNTTAILNFLSAKNLHDPALSLDFTELHWLLPSSTFFLSVTAALRSRLLLVESVWAFSLLHSAETELKELLGSNARIRGIVGENFRSNLLTTGREEWRHLEYFPLVNARAHVLGSNDRIANEKFRGTYRRFLRYLSDKSSISDPDRVCLSQHFTLQSRYEEAQDQLRSLSPTVSAQLGLQVDYLNAYLNVTNAKAITPRYAQFPIVHWRERFAAISKQVAEAENWTSPVSDSQPSMSVTLNDTTLQVYSQGLPYSTVRLHQINLEVVFSRSPFLSASMGACEFTAPLYQERVNLTSNAVVSYQLPAAYRRTNQFIVVESPVGHQWSKLYLASGLRVQVWEMEGKLKVTEETYKPVANAYVKVYAKHTDESVRFYKDGYTDDRGHFPYASLSTSDLSTSSQFSILISDSSLGATVLEVRPPAK